MGITNKFLNNKNRKGKMNGALFDKILFAFLIILIILLTSMIMITESSIVSIVCVFSVITFASFIIHHWTGE